MNNTSASDGTGPGEMTDEQLDEVLAAASTDLLAHVTAIADPTRTLTAIMARGDQQASVIALICARARAVALARELDHAQELAREFSGRDLKRLRRPGPGRAYDIIRDRDHALLHDCARALLRARALALALALDLDRDPSRRLAESIASSLNLVGDRGHSRESVLSLQPFLDSFYSRAAVRALTGAVPGARRIARELGERQADASGADLSGMEIRHLGTLDGITWTHETTWPPGITGQVRQNSAEIRPGVYQVRLGDARDREALPLA